MTEPQPKDVKTYAVYFCIGILMGLVIGLCIPCTALSVDEYGSNYILWNTTGSTNVSLDGTPIMVSGVVYGQYDLTSDTTHIIRDTDSNVSLSQTTSKSWIDYLAFWIFIIILFGSIIAAYLYPISCAFSIGYGVWLLSTYLPGESAAGASYMIVGIGIFLSAFAAIKGMGKI